MTVSQPKRRIPTTRPCGIAYTAEEVEILTRHQLYLDSLTSLQTVFAESKESGLLYRGWKSDQPGMWVRGLIGPLTTKQALERQAQEDNCYRQHGE